MVLTTLALMGMLAVPAPKDGDSRREQIESLKKASGDADPALDHKLAGLCWDEYQATDSGGDDLLALAAERYRRVIDRHPTYLKLDESMLGQGRVLAESSKPAEALASFKRLLKDFPKSRLAGDAWLSVGQLTYENAGGSAEALADAHEALRKAVPLKPQSLGLARYLLGKVELDLGENRGALDQLGQSVGLAFAEGDGDLAKDAMREYVAAFGRVGEPQLAIAEVKKVGGEEHSWDLLKDLAGAYHDSGRISDAGRLYTQLIKERPLSPDVPGFRCRLVGYVMRGGTKKAILAEVQELVKSLKAVQREGDFTREQDKRSFAEGREKAEAVISTLATNWHEEAQASGDPAAVTVAADLCSLYLGVFPDSASETIRKCSEGF